MFIRKRTQIDKNRKFLHKYDCCTIFRVKCVYAKERGTICHPIFCNSGAILFFKTLIFKSSFFVLVRCQSPGSFLERYPNVGRIVMYSPKCIIGTPELITRQLHTFEECSILFNFLSLTMDISLVQIFILIECNL